MPSRDVKDFIAHWTAASPSERANSQAFLIELCDLLDVPRPDNHPHAGYFFEFPVVEKHPDGTTTNGRIDLYKKKSFVLESKQFQEAKAEASQLELAAEEAGFLSRKKSSQPVRGTDAWDDAMIKARGQAERYVRALPDDNPPFIVVADVGHSFEIYSDFTQAGKAYLPFPDPRTFRIRLEQLADSKIRERLRLIWTNPAALDPAKRSADVTREISAHLAELAKSLEKSKHKPETVAQFLTRCLFCMFAEDVGLLPERSFTDLLESLPSDGSGFQEVLQTLFKEMNAGTGKTISVVLRKKLLKFNGGLFADDTVLPINGLQLGSLKEAAKQNWANAEPAIFGTLLERALNPGERHQLGAHYTPRAYVERLVLPTVIEPLRAEWENVRAAAVTLARAGELKKTRAVLDDFHAKLCRVTVLDPACGSGNFLYVALEHLKRLEGEVIDVAATYGESLLASHTVDPHQFLGLEINPRAAAIAELVLWIGYLQWHFRTRGETSMPEEPVLKKFNNIQCRDAVLAYDGEPQPALDAAGNAKSVWNRLGKKTDAVTGREVPDETKRVPLLTYTNPRPATWPEADFIVGNPPFIGTARMREDLGDGYAETLRAAYPDVPESANFVMYWWHKAAQLVSAQKGKRFGLITTNAISQTFNRRVVQSHLSGKHPFSLAFVIPDHPWVDTVDGAAVRIAMTVGVPGEHAGELLEIKTETEQADGSAKVTFKEHKGKISADLTLGANISAIAALKSNDGLACPGVKLHGSGFIVTPDEAKGLGLGKIRGLEKHIRPYRNGKDLTDEPRGVLVIDLFGLAEKEVREKFPAVYQHVLTTVKPERDANNRATYRDNWWIFGEPRRDFRPALAELRRYVATTETSKHRFFQFLDAEILPDNMVIAIALDDFFYLGVMSSRIHVVYSLAAGGVLEDRPRYNKSRCFDPFPFPLCGEREKARIRELAEALDAHRKQVQAKHGVTLTGLYNVLEKIRAGEKLNSKEQFIHGRGLVSTLKSLHDDLDAAVSAAYGWPASLTDAEILERLVALNAERAAEESRGVIHWLRPEYQAKGQQEIILESRPAKKIKAKAAKPKGKAAWPKKMAERVQQVETALHHFGAPASPAELATQFKRAQPADVAEILETLVTLGRARKQDEKYSR